MFEAASKRAAISVLLLICVTALVTQSNSLQFGYNGGNLTATVQQIYFDPSTALKDLPTVTNLRSANIVPSTTPFGNDLFVVTYTNTTNSAATLGFLLFQYNGLGTGSSTGVAFFGPQGYYTTIAPFDPNTTLLNFAFNYSSQNVGALNHFVTMYNTGSASNVIDVYGGYVPVDPPYDTTFIFAFGEDVAALSNFSSSQPVPIGATSFLDTTVAVPAGSDVYLNVPINSLYIFGGYTIYGYSNTMYRTNGVDNQNEPSSWIEVVPDISSPVPEARSFHAGTFYNGSYFMFGGHNDTGVFGDTWVYTTANATWRLLHDFGFVSYSETDLTRADLVQHSTDRAALPWSPPARYSHTMTTLFGTNSLTDTPAIILMSCGTNGIYFFDDMWAFDPATMNWEVFNMTGTGWSGRAYTTFSSDPVYPYTFLVGGSNDSSAFTDAWSIDLSPATVNPSFKPIPNDIIAGVAGGILLVLIVTVVVLKLTDRNTN